mgnify:FL=1
MPYEKFDSPGRRSGSEPMISLRKSGSIGINNAALEEHFQDAEAVAVYYNEEENRIGLEPLEEKTDESYTLSKTESGGSVAPTAFLRKYSLIPDITTQYEPFEDEDLVAIDLDQEIGTYGEPAED